MHVLKLVALARTLLLAAIGVVALGGCSSMTTSLGKKIDYKSTAVAPALELPPDLKSPQYDDRYNVATASAVAATRDAARPKTADQIAPIATANARIVRSGTTAGSSSTRPRSRSGTRSTGSGSTSGSPSPSTSR